MWWQSEVWVHRVGHSPVSQILLPIVFRAVITSSPPALLGPVLMRCCQLQLTFLSSMIVLQPPLLSEGWGGHPLCLGTVQHWWISIGLVVVQLRAVFCSSVQYLTICHSSVRHFPEWSWPVVTFPCFTVVKSFTLWYALLLLFFLRISSISLHCSPTQFS